MLRSLCGGSTLRFYRSWRSADDAGRTVACRDLRIEGATGSPRGVSEGRMPALLALARVQRQGLRHTVFPRRRSAVAPHRAGEHGVLRCWAAMAEGEPRGRELMNRLVGMTASLRASVVRDLEATSHGR